MHHRIEAVRICIAAGNCHTGQFVSCSRHLIGLECDVVCRFGHAQCFIRSRLSRSNLGIQRCKVIHDRLRNAASSEEGTTQYSPEGQCLYFFIHINSRVVVFCFFSALFAAHIASKVTKH